MAAMTLSAALPADLPPWLDVDPLALDAAVNSVAHRERWKYTRPQKVLNLLEAEAREPDFKAIPDGVTISRADDSTGIIEIFRDQEAPATEALFNLCRQRALIIVDVETVVTKPLILQYSASALPVLLRLAPNTSLELQELANAAADSHQSLWIEMAPGSRLSHSRQAFGEGSCYQHLSVLQERDSHYALNSHTAGTTLRRQDVHIVSAASGTHTEIVAANFLPERSHFDLQITMEHRAPQSTSRQRVHTIADDGAKATFNGRIHIHPNAGGVDAELSNKNLTLGDSATINTKPELEIYTDDVKCAHGATVGKLDPQHLFYCASRGISATDAQRLLSQAFLATCTEGPLAEASRARFGEYVQ